VPQQRSISRGTEARGHFAEALCPLFLIVRKAQMVADNHAL